MIPNLLSAIFPNLEVPKNKALEELKPAEQIINKSIPGLAPVLDRERMISGNPTKIVGDTITQIGGGDPNAGVLDNIDPTRTLERHSGGVGFFPQTGDVNRGRGGVPFGAAIDAGMNGDDVTTTGEVSTKILPRQPEPLPDAPSGIFPRSDGYNAVDTSAIDEMSRQQGANRVYPQIDATAPEIAPTVTGATNPVPTVPITPVNKESDMRRKLSRLETEGMPKEHSFWKRALGGALRGLSTGMIGGNIGSGIGGAIAGSLGEGFFPKANTEIRTQAEIAKTKAALDRQNEVRKADQDAAYKQATTDEILRRPEKEEATRTQQREIQELRGKQALERINRNADVKAGIAKPVINEGGFIELEYLNADSSGKRRDNELLKGADGQPIFVPGEQGLTWIDPQSNQPVQVKAKQTLIPGATIAAGNANRQTDADKTNALQYWKTQDTNIQNQLKWMSDVKSLMTSAIAADSGMADDPGTRAEMDGKLQEITALSNTPLPETDDPNKAQEARVKRVNELVDDYNSLNNKLLDTLSKSAAGKAKADQIRGMIANMPKVPKLTYTPYKPTMVTGGVTGKPVPAGKDPMGLFR